MEAVRQWEKVSVEAETEDVALRGRLPRHQDTKSGNGHFGLEGGLVDFSITSENPSVQIISSVVENQLCELDLPGLSSPSPSQKSLQKEYSTEYSTVVKDLRDKGIEEPKELNLENLYEKQGPHEFYCPNCKVCITKVLVCDRDQLGTAPSTPPVVLSEITEPIRCTSCFSFLIPGWLVPKLLRSADTNQADVTRDLRTPEGTITVSVESSTDQTPPVVPEQITNINETTDQTAVRTPEQRSRNTWEIVKSIVYGGLAQSITSLGIVTSAASGGSSTLNIVALALANLLGGLFVIGHNLWELKHEPAASDTDDEQVVVVDRYQESSWTEREFHSSCLCCRTIIPCFRVSASCRLWLLIPSERRQGPQLKLAAVAAASLLCIVLLSFAKAYTQSHNPSDCIKTVTYYVVVGLGVSGASYVAGDLIHKLMEKLNWFEYSSSTPAHVTLPLAEMGKRAWESY